MMVGASTDDIVIWGRYLFLCYPFLSGVMSCGTVETKLGHGEGIFARDFGEEQVCGKGYREQRNRHGLCHGSYLLLIIGGRTNKSNSSCMHMESWEIN